MYVVHEAVAKVRSVIIIITYYDANTPRGSLETSLLVYLTGVLGDKLATDY